MLHNIDFLHLVQLHWAMTDHDLPLQRGRKLNQTQTKRRQAARLNSGMLLFLKKCNNFLHGIVKMIKQGRRGKHDDGILIMVPRRVTTDDDPTVRRSSPIFNLHTIRNERSRIHNKVRHPLLRLSVVGGNLEAMER
jgi:hypothetical protein